MWRLVVGWPPCTVMAAAVGRRRLWEPPLVPPLVWPVPPLVWPPVLRTDPDWLGGRLRDSVWSDSCKQKLDSFSLQVRAARED